MLNNNASAEAHSSLQADNASHSTGGRLPLLLPIGPAVIGYLPFSHTAAQIVGQYQPLLLRVREEPNWLWRLAVKTSLGVNADEKLRGNQLTHVHLEKMAARTVYVCASVYVNNLHNATVKVTLPQGNQELLVVKDKVGRPPGELGVSKSTECDIFPFSVLTLLCDRKGIRPVKELGVGLLVVMN